MLPEYVDRIRQLTPDVRPLSPFLSHHGNAHRLRAPFACGTRGSQRWARLSGAAVLTVDQALDLARIVGAEAISEEEAVELLKRITGWSPTEAAEFIAVARGLKDPER
jgi:hypothetical protein